MSELVMMRAKSMNQGEVEHHLRPLGLCIGPRNQIALTSGELPAWIKFKAPRDAHELLTFSQHAAGWLPDGKWSILQLDDSNYFDTADAFFIQRALLGSQDCAIEGRSYLFEGDTANRQHRLMWSLAIYLLLLIEGHAQLVSSGGVRLLSLQDGFVYFLCDEPALQEAKVVIQTFEANPSRGPKWLLNFKGSE